jgi:hypothetical protein
MIAHGNPPYLECSSAGDRRFSAFYAKVHGVSIEVQYQAYKEFRGHAGGIATGLSWREAKGRKPLNAEAAARFYSRLWDQYIDEHPELLAVLKSASGLCDKFGQVGHVCQATELWRIRNAD